MCRPPAEQATTRLPRRGQPLRHFAGIQQLLLCKQQRTQACRAVVLAGALLGFAVPLASALRVANGLLDVAAWAFMA